MIRAVVFDFDGVIANSEPLHFRAFREVLTGRGIALTERDYYDRYLGFDDAGAFAAIAQDRGVRIRPAEIDALVEEKAARMEALEQHASVLFAGAREAIERLAAAYPCAIASGAIRADIVRVLDREELSQFFRAVVAAEDTEQSKPAPDPYVRAVALLNESTHGALSPSECVAIEDSRWGLQSARSAGLRTIGIAHTYSPDALTNADLVVTHLDQITSVLLAQL